MSPKNSSKARRILSTACLLISCLLLVSGSVAQAQQAKPPKPNLTGRYEGIAKNKAEDVITVTLDLTEKEGALSGAIHSSHGDFTIIGGTHKDDAVTLDFDAGGSSGTLSLRLTDDKLVGTWTAGDDGGPVDVKKAAAQPDAPKGKS